MNTETPNIVGDETISKRLAAAEEVCWTLLMMMAFGGLEIPVEDRKLLGDKMQEWVDLSIETGTMKEDGK